jgi:hypothetical protein
MIAAQQLAHTLTKTIIGRWIGFHLPNLGRSFVPKDGNANIPAFLAVRRTNISIWQCLQPGKEKRHPAGLTLRPPLADASTQLNPKFFGHATS